MRVVLETCSTAAGVVRETRSRQQTRNTARGNLIINCIEKMLKGFINAYADNRKVLEKMITCEPIASSDQLTARENIFTVVRRFIKRIIVQEIAIKLNIAIGTVRQHMHSIFEKLHVTSVTEALNKTLNKK